MYCVTALLKIKKNAENISQTQDCKYPTFIITAKNLVRTLWMQFGIS